MVCSARPVQALVRHVHPHCSRHCTAAPQRRRALSPHASASLLRMSCPAAGCLSVAHFTMGKAFTKACLLMCCAAGSASAGLRVALHACLAGICNCRQLASTLSVSPCQRTCTQQWRLETGSDVQKVPASAVAPAFKLSLPLDVVNRSLSHLVNTDFELASSASAINCWQGQIMPRRNKERYAVFCCCLSASL